MDIVHEDLANIVDNRGLNALHLAFAAHNAGAVKALLDVDCRTDVADNDGKKDYIKDIYIYIFTYIHAYCITYVYLLSCVGLLPVYHLLSSEESRRCLELYLCRQGDSIPFSDD